MLKTYTEYGLKEILRLHREYVLGNAGGRRADLSGADLRSANLRSADLRSADLRSADLRSADLSGANLRSADLRSANLSGADLRSANLRSADLSGADLRSADLRSANLRSADLSGADLSGDEQGLKEAMAAITIVPQNGAFEGFKKLRGDLVAHLSIPADAARVGGPCGRKCRAEFADVIGLYTIKQEPSLELSGHSIHNYNFIYTTGERVTPASYDPSALIECAPGIHFFLTFEEAANYW